MSRSDDCSGVSIAELSLAAASFGADFSAGAGGACGTSTSSTTSLRSAPSDVKSRRSVTVKLDCSCFFSAIKTFPSELLSEIPETKSAPGAPFLAPFARSGDFSWHLYHSPLTNFLKRQLYYLRRSRTNRDLAARHGSFPPDVSQGHAPTKRPRQRSDAGHLAYVLLVHNDLRARRDLRPILRDEAGKHPVHVATRANALDDLLPDVAALGEAQGPRLFRFLRQLALANIHAIEWNARKNAVRLHRLGPHRDCVRGQQSVPESFHIGGRKPDLIRYAFRVFAIVLTAYEGAIHASPLDVDDL